METSRTTSLWAPRGSGTTSADASGRVPLSFQLEFLNLVDPRDESGPFGPRYTIVGGWRIGGPLEESMLEAALADLVVRHEALRSRIVRGADGVHQEILPPASPELAVVDLPDVDPDMRDLRAEEFLNEVESCIFPIGQVPQLRAVLGRFDRRDAVLVLVAHHTVADGWSFQVIARDLAACYTARRQRRGTDLPALRPYRDYVRWQRAAAASPAARAAREYWQEQLSGAQVHPIPIDRPRSNPGSATTSWHRFLVGNELRSAVGELAGRLRSTPFMVMLGAYLAYLHETTGATDLVVPTFTPGRRPAWTQDMVGSFFNLVPLRTDVAGCDGLREIVARVRATSLAAYAHEIPFVHLLETAPELMLPAAGEHHAACVFQVVQSPFTMHRHLIGDLRFTAMRRRLLSQPVGSQIPDGALWAMELDATGGIVGSIGYGSGQFTERTIAEMVAGYCEVLRRLIAAPDRW